MLRRTLLFVLLVASAAALVTPAPGTRLPCAHADDTALDGLTTGCHQVEEESIENYGEAVGELQARHLSVAVHHVCLEDALVINEALLEGKLEKLDRGAPEFAGLARRRGRLRLARAAIGIVERFRTAFTSREDGVPSAYGTGTYERRLRKQIVVTSDTRLLGIASFRGAWQDLLAVGEMRRTTLVTQMDEEVERLARMSGADETKAGRKALALRVLADELDAEMQRLFAELGTPRTFPELEEFEDRDAKRSRKLFKGTAKGYASLLVVLARVHAKIGRKVDAAIEDAADIRGCPLTSKFVKEIGGGAVLINIDSAPTRRLDGQTDVQIFADPALREFVFGSDTQFERGKPYIQIHLEGDAFAKPGTYEVTGFPDRDGDGKLRDFIHGHFLNRPESGGSVRYNFKSGTVTIETLVVGKKRNKRLIEGYFDLVAETVGGSFQKRLEGTFHLCRWQYFDEFGNRN